MFFSIPIEDVRTLFDLMDGDYWEDAAAAAYDIPKNEEQILEKKELEIKEKMLECLFQKCEELEMDIENRKAELSELNATIEERKSALRDLDLQGILDTQIITEY